MKVGENPRTIGLSITMSIVIEKKDFSLNSNLSIQNIENVRKTINRKIN